MIDKLISHKLRSENAMAEHIIHSLFNSERAIFHRDLYFDVVEMGKFVYRL